MSTPRVSVIVAAYNAEAFLERTLASVLRQTFTDLELLVIDDGSTDGTARVVRRVMERDPRVHLIEQANRGLSATRNRAIGESRGELIALLDHDDLWHPQKLARQIAVLDARPDVGLVSCYSAVLDASQRCLGWRVGGDAQGDVYAEMLEWDMVSGGSVPLVRRAALETVGLFDEHLGSREDWDIWIRLARRVAFATVPQTLVGYTRSARSTSRDYEQMANEGVQVLDKARRDDAEFRGRRYRYSLARDHFAIACFCAFDHEVGHAWQYLARSWSATPRAILGAPRRWAFVGVLVAQTLLPRAAFRQVFGLLCRMSFRLVPGTPFDDLSRQRPRR